jgi:hypothetical protein
MSIDDVLIAVIVGGLGLAYVYMRAELISLRRYKSGAASQGGCAALTSSEKTAIGKK